jgi:hypothetical protein
MALAVHVLAVTIDVRRTFHGLTCHAAVFARRDHATANGVCTLLGIRCVHLISHDPVPPSRPCHRERVRSERPELQDRDRPTDPAQILLVSAARFYYKKGTHGGHATPQMPFAGGTLQTSYLAADPRL